MAEDRRGPVCPKCRAVGCRYEEGRYICGTYTVRRTGGLFESPTCLRRQIEQRTHERDEALAECAEQARLLGISGSKEARMQAKLDAYHTEREKIWAALSEKAEADIVQCLAQRSICEDPEALEKLLKHSSSQPDVNE